MIIEPKKRGIFDLDPNSRSLDEILLPTELETEKASNLLDKEYDKLVQEFKYKTALTDLDLKILVFCSALQVLRWSILSNETLKFNKASTPDKLVEKAKKKIDNSKYIPTTIKELITDFSVPYDATVRSDRFKKIYGDDFTTGLSGTTHRYRALGHDPIAGWIVGTANIATNTITVNNGIINFDEGKIKIDKDVKKLLKEWYPSYHVKNQEIYAKTHISKIFEWTTDIVQEKPKVLVVSLLKHSIHMGTDFFTKQGLPIPFLNTLSPEISKYLMDKNIRIDTWSVAKGALLSMLINWIVWYFHRLWFNPNVDDNKLYEARTRKVLMYSNTLSSIINVGYVGLSNDYKKIDIGGIGVTLWRLINDSKKMQNIFSEFIERTMSNDLQKQEDEVREQLARFGYSF